MIILSSLFCRQWLQRLLWCFQPMHGYWCKWTSVQTAWCHIQSRHLQRHFRVGQGQCHQSKSTFIHGLRFNIRCYERGIAHTFVGANMVSKLRIIRNKTTWFPRISLFPIILNSIMFQLFFFFRLTGGWLSLSACLLQFCSFFSSKYSVCTLRVAIRTCPKTDRSERRYPPCPGPSDAPPPLLWQREAQGPVGADMHDNNIKVVDLTQCRDQHQPMDLWIWSHPETTPEDHLHETQVKMAPHPNGAVKTDGAAMAPDNPPPTAIQTTRLLFRGDRHLPFTVTILSHIRQI